MRWQYQKNIRIDGKPLIVLWLWHIPIVRPYRASVHDTANYLMDLMQNAELRKKMGKVGRKRAVENYDRHVTAKRFVGLVSDRFGVL